jgi:phage shock protein C
MSKTLQRDPANKVIGGVCSGLANYFGTEPLLFRAIFLLIIFIGGGGVLVYIILWAVLPEGKYGDQFKQDSFNETPKTETVNKEDGSPDMANISMGLLLLSAGILLMVNNLVPEFNFKKFWPLILIIVGGGLMIGSKKPSTQSSTSSDEEK